MELPGIVTNITNFGAFVDIGVHQDGLVHISQLSDRFVTDPTQVIRLHQHVRVRVVEVGYASQTYRIEYEEYQTIKIYESDKENPCLLRLYRVYRLGRMAPYRRKPHPQLIHYGQ